VIRAARAALGALLALGAAFGLAAVTTAPRRPHTDGEARLRVAFSARPERIENCRTLSERELANLPAHMRQSVVCEGFVARYRLEVRRDDSLVASALVRGGGLRHDRQLYVLRELALPSGRSTIDVRLTRIDAATPRPGRAREESDHHGDGGAHHDSLPGSRAGAGDPEDENLAQRDEEEHRRRIEDEVPASLVLRETVTLRPREVLLVTYDQPARRFRTVRGPR
jgi:hypothetical protein